MDTVAGVGDRLRTAAFAELQAREAFLWAADTFEDAPAELREAWRGLAYEEQKHMDWLMNRMQVLGISVTERKVSDMLWRSLMTCKTGREFAAFIATAEERGRKAGVRFQAGMAQSDPESARIFGKIAEEEVSHIEIATRFYGVQILERTSSGLKPLSYGNSEIR
jgi:uncharacterized ferritin-like protein (DUF455 family)